MSASVDHEDVQEVPNRILVESFLGDNNIEDLIIGMINMV